MRILDGAFNGTHRAISGTEGTSFTFILQDDDLHQVFANAGRAFLVNYMGDIFVAEIFECGQNRVGSGLTQATEGVLLDVLAEFFHLV